MPTNVYEFHPIDLHIHSSYSEDGEFTPSELIHMCIEAGLSMMAIADHNCVRGARELIRLKNEMEKTSPLGLSCYPAIEIDCTFQTINFHVLGYNIDLMSTDFDEIEQNVRSQCTAASKERLRLINGLGFHLTEVELKEITSLSYWSEHWTGEVFAEALLNNPEYLDDKLLLPYREGGARSDNPYVNFYWDYCSLGKPCYVGMSFPEMKEVIDIIHRNNGKAVLAHPGINLKGNFDLIEELIPLGLDGIEAFSSYHDVNTAQWFFTKAKQHNLCVTRGSDFHGKTKPSIWLGYSGVNIKR